MILLAFAAWTATTLLLFARRAPRRAMLAALVSGWLLLPVSPHPVAGLPDLEKSNLIALVLAGTSLVFDGRRWAALRPRWFDLPLLVWCATPMASSLANDLGWYDGASAVLHEILLWGIPYALGRLYCADLEGLRDLAAAIVLGGFAYVPLCLFEVVEGPILDQLVYGLPEVSAELTWRFGGWRPIVFLDTGLMVAVWMVAASLSIVWSGWWRRMAPPFAQAVRLLGPLLLLTLALLKSVNGWALFALGLLTRAAIRHGAGRWAMAVLVAAPPLYVGVRASELWTGTGLRSLVAAVSGSERGGSIRIRVFNERLMMRKALRRPLFGWGGWSRSQLRPDGRTIIGIPDSLWIRVLGRRGFVGLIACFALLALAPLRLCWSHPVDDWLSPGIAPAAALAVVICLFAIDCCMNDMLNPVYLVACGGLVSLERAGALARRQRAAPD